MKRGTHENIQIKRYDRTERTTIKIRSIKNDTESRQKQISNQTKQTESSSFVEKKRGRILRYRIDFLVFYIY